MAPKINLNQKLEEEKVKLSKIAEGITIISGLSVLVGMTVAIDNHYLTKRTAEGYESREHVENGLFYGGLTGLSIGLPFYGFSKVAESKLKIGKKRRKK